MDPAERCFILEKMTNLDDRKRKLIVAQLLLDSSSDSSDDEILHMLIKEKIMRPKHKKRTSMIPSYSEEEASNSCNSASLQVKAIFSSLVSPQLSHEKGYLHSIDS